MSAILEEAIEEVRALPPEERQQLRELAANFGEVLIMALLMAAFVKPKDPTKWDLDEIRALLEKAASELPKAKDLAERRSQRAALSRSIRGKYAHLPTGSETFIALKREETKLEDSKFKDH